MKMRALLFLAVVVLAACATRYTERNNTGNNHYANAEYESALRAYQAAQVAAPDRPEAYFNAAAALAGGDDLNRAAAALQEALESADDTLLTSAYYNLGNVYYQMTRYNEAIDAYQQVLLIDPDHEDARHNLELALLRYVPPTPTAQEQQTEPQQGETDPETTPTNQPQGFDDPTPTQPPVDFDLTATPDSGQGGAGEDDSTTPVPQSQGEMTVEQAERLLDQIQQDQEALSEYQEAEASSGDVTERDW
ncbi:MAG: hypothetical protein OHK0046_07580 [Anaerolineae bacterium]